MAPSWRTRLLLIACGRYPHLDRVFLMVVKQGNSLVVLLNAIDSHARRLAAACRLFSDCDMVDSFPVSVVYPECLPISREARGKSQFIYFQPQPVEGQRKSPLRVKRIPQLGPN
jgi:hypothetical protein